MTPKERLALEMLRTAVEALEESLLGSRRGERMSENKKLTPKLQYCWDCGREMEIQHHIGSYDRDTGRRNSYYTYRCPDNKWWNSHGKWAGEV